MSGEFGEDFKPAKGSDLGKEQPAEQQSPFHAELQNERAAASKASDSKAEEKAEPKKVADTSHEKFQEGTGKNYSDWLAENKSPKENYEALEKSLLAAVAKMRTLTEAGYGDVVSGGSYLANLVKDSSPADVSKFLSNVKDYLEKK